MPMPGTEELTEVGQLVLVGPGAGAAVVEGASVGNGVVAGAGVAPGAAVVEG